ncbi:MAG: transglycosylase SLT domain-containing protein [Bacteroidota bacterium]|nr:transglycosylase SLT domain-containing protein [Bacteroidota bacterium]
MRFLLLFTIFLYSCRNSASTSKKQVPPIKSEVNKDSIAKLFCNNDLCSKVVGVINPQTSINENYIFDNDLYNLGIDTVAQVKFWRNIMNLNDDSALVNIASSREVLNKVEVKSWSLRNDSIRTVYKDSVRLAKQLDSTQKILLTTGKKFFYDFNKTSQNFDKGIHCFIENGVDPWYAQAILLIESPNKLQKSNAGAYGSFQLMKDVARLFGLKVNKQIDERADFERSAYAASSLIKKVCIPKAHKMLDSLKITNQNENELWFKLLVMHVYHAGSYNVEKALFSFMPTQGDINLIYNLWHASTAKFKNASQNYSQLILAAMLEMNEHRKVPEKPKIVKK